MIQEPLLSKIKACCFGRLFALKIRIKFRRPNSQVPLFAASRFRSGNEELSDLLSKVKYFFQNIFLKHFCF